MLAFRMFWDISESSSNNIPNIGVTEVITMLCLVMLKQKLKQKIPFERDLLNGYKYLLNGY